ncbi:hypothetical protein HDU67_002663 [Dinochytrium kinnereticum]|nr:hypothetical protein HDU67_002663 [Dinochytrium kinnereticum]
MSFPSIPEPNPMTPVKSEGKERKDKNRDETDSYDLVSEKRVLIDLAVPVKVSDMPTDRPNHPLLKSSSSFPSDPSSSANRSSSISISSVPVLPKGQGVVEVKFRFDMTSDEAADLPPTSTIGLPEGSSSKEEAGVQYELRVVARFVGTFENKEVEEKVPIVWPKFHPDAVARVVGTGERKVKRMGVSNKGFKWRWEIISGVGALGDMRPIALFIDSTSGDVKRGLATVSVFLTETKEWTHINHKKEQRVQLGTYLEDHIGEFDDKTVTFALPLSLRLQPTLDYDPVKITHTLSVHIEANAMGTSEKILDVRSEIPYAIAGFTRDDCDDLISEEGNIPLEVLAQMPRDYIGKRLNDMEYIKFSAETLTRIVKDKSVESPGIVGNPRTPWSTFQNVMTALKRTRKASVNEN